MTESPRDPYCYLASEYYATGEGQTICLYIARYYDLDDEVESFRQRFGFYAEYFEVFERQHFFEQYKSLIPAQVVKFVTELATPCGFVWSCEFHVSYS